MLLEKTPSISPVLTSSKKTRVKHRIDLRARNGKRRISRRIPGYVVTLAAIYPFPNAVQLVTTGKAGFSRLSAPRNQGNWVSRRELAWAAVSRGAARGGTVAGGVGIWARRSRWLRP
jgi:hypothetical protein